MIEPLRKTLGIERELPPRPFTPPVFLTGCMRSGTTFLANLLGEHPGLLHLEGELNQVWTQIGGIDCSGNRRYADRTDVSTEATANMSAYFERCKLEFSQRKYDWWRVINKVKKGSGGIKKDWSDLMLLNKSVHLINRTDYLLHMFPGSKCLLLIRPLEAQVNSLRMHFERNEANGVFIKNPERAEDSWINLNDPNAKNWNLETLATKWVELNIRALGDLKNNSSDQSLVVSYEKMVHQPEATLVDIFQFLNRSHFDINLANTLEDRKAFNTNTGGNPLTDWQQRFSEEDLKVIKKVREQYAREIAEIESYL